MGFKTLFKGGGSENCEKVADLGNRDRGKEERRQVTQSNWVVTPLRGAAGQRNKIGWRWRRLLPHSSMITFCCRFWRSFSVFDHGLLFATFKGFKSTTLKSCQCNGSWTHAMYSSNKGDLIPQMEEGMMGGGVWIGITKVILFPRAKPYSLRACQFRQPGILFNEIWKLRNCWSKPTLICIVGGIKNGSANSM